MKNKENELLYVGEPHPNYGHLAIAEELGYSSVRGLSYFEDEYIPQLLRGMDNEIRYVAVDIPLDVVISLLNEGLSVIDFKDGVIDNEEVKTSYCKGAYIFWMEEGKIKQRWVTCPLSDKEQLKKAMDWVIP